MRFATISRKHFAEDPPRYEKLSERLKGILKEFEGRLDELTEALKQLVREARRGRQRDDSTGLDPETQAPFFDVLKHEVVGDGELEGAALDTSCKLTVELVDHIRQDRPCRILDTREGTGWATELEFMTLDDADVLPFDRLEPVADKLMELAKANDERLTR